MGGRSFGCEIQKLAPSFRGNSRDFPCPTNATLAYLEDWGILELHSERIECRPERDLGVHPPLDCWSRLNILHALT